MNLQQLYSFPKDRVRALFGLEPAALGQLLAAVLPELITRRRREQQAKPGRRRNPGGGRRRKLHPYQEVLLTLVYLRRNVSHAVCGQMFCVSADISENSFHEVVLLLRDLCPAHRFDAEKKWTKKEPSWHPDTLDVVLVDSFETPVARPSLPDAQRKLYSGKKKRHTLKTQIVTEQIVTDKNGAVLAIEPGYPGPLPDKTLYEQSAYEQSAYEQSAYEQSAYEQSAYEQSAYEQSAAAGQYPQAARRADLAYQGVPEMLLPHKKKRGKAGGKAKELTPQQKDENRFAASERVPVEHVCRLGACSRRAWRSPVQGLAHLARRVPARARAVCAGGDGHRWRRPPWAWCIWPDSAPEIDLGQGAASPLTHLVTIALTW